MIVSGVDPSKADQWGTRKPSLAKGLDVAGIRSVLGGGEKAQLSLFETTL